MRQKALKLPVYKERKITEPLLDAILVAPPCNGIMEGFPGAITTIKNYLDEKVGPKYSRILDMEREAHQRIPELVRENISQERVIVGLTCTSATYQRAKEVARLIKNHNPKAIVILGGHHVKEETDQAKFALNDSAIDYVCLGDGEKTLEALIRGKEKQDVPNVAYMEEGQIKRTNLGRMSNEELNEIPFQIYDTKSRAGKFEYEEITYVSARGCNYHCAFCAVGNDRIRAFKQEKIIQDIWRIVKFSRERGIGRPQVAFENNFFSRQIGETYELALRIIEEKRKHPDFDFNWNCQTRVEYFQKEGLDIEEFVRALYESGANRIYVGVDNFDPRMLLLMAKKGTPVEAIEVGERIVEKKLQDYEQKYLAAAVKDAQIITKFPIQMQFLFIVGRPEEDELTEKINIEKLREIKMKIKGNPGTLVILPSLSVVYPGTYDARRLEMMIGEKWDEVFEEFTYMMEYGVDEQIKDLKKLMSTRFAHGAGGIPWGILNLDSLRNRRFVVDKKKLERVIGYYQKFKDEEDEGFKVFDYSQYLVDL